MRNIPFGKWTVLLVLLALVIGCKKDITKIEPPPRPGDGNRTEDQKVKDEIYNQYKRLSYWEEFIPVYNPASSFTDQFNNADAVLARLMSMTPQYTQYEFHPDRVGPLDHYSWIEYTDEEGSRASKADLADGYGMVVYFIEDRKDSLYVGFVEGGSPAEAAGLERGDKIIEMAGDKKMVSTNAEAIERYVQQNTLPLTWITKDNKTISKTLTYTTYDIQPFQLAKVFKEGTKEIAYIGLSSFEELTNGGRATEMKNKIDQAFTDFAKTSAKDLIVDLRYNGGGYVSSAAYLLNKIVNSSGNNKLMFKYDLNKNLEEERAEGDTEFADEIFKKSSTTEFANVYFLTTFETASAAEIIISALKPYANVKVLGYNGATYGKPVGFFREDITADIGLWAASFKIINAQDFTDYWDGIKCDYPYIYDNVEYDFGEPNEDMPGAAFNLITTGKIAATQTTARSRVIKRSFSPQVRVPVNKRPVREMIKD